MASNDGSLHVWDPEPGQRLLNFESEASPFTAFRPLFDPFTIAAATQESLWYSSIFQNLEGEVDLFGCHPSG